jgi:hypothetical protein
VRGASLPALAAAAATALLDARPARRDGRQHLIVAVGSANYGAEFVAFCLPTQSRAAAAE